MSAARVCLLVIVVLVVASCALIPGPAPTTSIHPTSTSLPETADVARRCASAGAHGHDPCRLTAPNRDRGPVDGLWLLLPVAYLGMATMVVSAVRRGVVVVWSPRR